MTKPDAPARKWPRRALLAGGGAAVLAAGGVLLARKPDRGGAHDAYFEGVSAALRRAGIAQPTLVIDRARLDANIRTARATLAAKALPLRVVVKSLPSPRLIETVASGLGSDRFMVFNGAMLAQTARLRPAGDLLLGKPLPAAQARRLIEDLPPEAIDRVQWLVDDPRRLKQYAAIARARGRPLRVNLEIDVGLHRGGFADLAALVSAVRAIAQDQDLTFAGLMGYDPHVPGMPDPEAAYRKSQDFYAAAISALKARGVDPAGLTLNSAGSPTYARHAKGTVANEVSVGSAFVKPTHFDTPWLERHVPAAFIATPAIKAGRAFKLPGVEWASGVQRFFDPNAARAFFIYGGNWLAEPVSPPGLQFSSLFGRSSNQELLTGSESVRLRADDYVFFRPAQSEAVFLQFGDIAIYDGGEISEFWPTLPVSA